MSEVTAGNRNRTVISDTSYSEKKKKRTRVQSAHAQSKKHRHIGDNNDISGYSRADFKGKFQI